jgi:hypothetical protein
MKAAKSIKNPMIKTKTLIIISTYKEFFVTADIPAAIFCGIYLYAITQPNADDVATRKNTIPQVIATFLNIPGN